MYTEFHFNSALKKDTPECVIKMLNFMLGVDGNSAPDIEHPLFKSGANFALMLNSDSYYFDADTISSLRFDDISKKYYLCIRCNLKNYCDEIALFCDWIDPYLDKYSGEFLGFFRYEQSEYPSIIRKKSSNPSGITPYPVQSMNMDQKIACATAALMAYEKERGNSALNLCDNQPAIGLICDLMHYLALGDDAGKGGYEFINKAIIKFELEIKSY